MSNFAAAIKAELQELETELSADPRFRRMVKLRELLPDYEQTPVPVKIVGSIGAPRDPEQAPVKAAQALTKAGKVKNALAAFMVAQGRRVSRQEMLDHLMDKGLLGAESRPLKRLAIYLTQAKKDGLFSSDGNGNWTLRAKIVP